MSEYVRRQIKNLYNPNNDYRRDVPVSFAEYELLRMIENLEDKVRELENQIFQNWEKNLKQDDNE